MIDINLPQTLSGFLVFLLVAFVVITALITTGLLPVVLALAIGAVVVYVTYIILIRIHRLFKDTSVRRSSGGDS